MYALYYYCFILTNLAVFGASHKITTGEDAVHYLSKFGYLEPMDNLPSEEAVNSYHLYLTEKYISSLFKAVLRFQEFAGVQATGKLDSTTMNVMNKPRCGNPDMTNGIQFRAFRSKRYLLSDFRWNTEVITYRIMEYPKTTRMYAWLAHRFTTKHVDYELFLAFSFWAQASGLRFENVNSGEVDIEIRFAEMYHGGKYDRNFDGPGTEIAHAFLPDPSHPLHGDIHFDNDEPWISGGILENTFHFRWAAVHEIGHALGLQHSSENTSYMFPMYPNDYDPVWGLHEDDVRGIRALYPGLNRRNNQSIPEDKTKPTTTPDPTPDLDLNQTISEPKKVLPFLINPFILKGFIPDLQPKFTPYNRNSHAKKSDNPYSQLVCKSIRRSYSSKWYYYKQRDRNAIQTSKYICVPFQFFV